MNSQVKDLLTARPYRNFIYTPDIYKNTELYTNAEFTYNSTQHSRQHTSQGVVHSKPSESLSRSKLFSYHVSKEKSKAQSVVLKKQVIDLETSKKLTDLESTLKSRAQKSSVLSTECINLKKNSAAQSQRYLKQNIIKNFEIFAEKRKKLLFMETKKALEKPQKMADTLNKPGVNTWMNLASGGRLRSVSADLPAPTGPSNLKTWEIFSGYLGPIKKPKVDLEVFTEKKDDCGFCYKVQPIYQNLTYEHAAYYLQLRKQGVNKKQALRLSQKIHCNLYEKEVKIPQSYSNEDKDYDKLIKRFEKYAKKHLIKEGEIMKDDQIQSDFLESTEKYLKVAHVDEEKLQENSRKDKEEKPKKDPELLKLQKILRTSIRTRSLSQAIKCEESEKNEKFFRHSATVNDPETEIQAKGGVKFMISGVLPIKEKARNESQESEEEEEEFYKSGNIVQTIECELNGQGNLNDLERVFEEASLKFPESDKVEVQTLGFKPTKFEELLKKSEKKIRVADKIRKKIEKKQEINLMNAEYLQKTLGKKLNKLRKIAEDKKKVKEEGLKVSKQKKTQFMEKVRVMKEKKENGADIEAEMTRKKVQEKLRKAEENKKKFEIEREKKLEEHRVFYDSKRVFFEYLKSLALIQNSESTVVQ